MNFPIPEAGAVDSELSRQIDQWWRESAERSGIDLRGFDSSAPLEERIACALSIGLVIGLIYSRYSSKQQHSTDDQVRTCVQHAAAKGIYCPPEYVSADEGQRGYYTRRLGLDRTLLILKHTAASVLLVFKASRLYRQAFKGYALIQQEVVEEGYRAISVTQGIDTADTKAWKMLFQVHGMVDDMVVEATADHVRAGLKGLFSRGYTVGALPIGYRRKELPSGPLTNRGLPRTVPEIDPEVARQIVEHFEAIRGGMPLKRGWQKWVADGGPADPRSTKGYLSYPAYRRMLSRTAYTGRWEFGRTRNEFSTKRDYSRQLPQPESEVEVVLCEELRIVDDELFYAVQERLATFVRGPRGPRKEKSLQLWDMVVDLFWCARCNERFYQAGANGHGMQCKNGDLCPCRTTVRRKEATKAVCDAIAERIRDDAELIEQVACRAQEIDGGDAEQTQGELSNLERKITSTSRKIEDLYELAGQGSDADRKEVMGKIRSVQAERSVIQHAAAELRRSLTATQAVISPEAVRQILTEFTELLELAATGKLGGDAVYKAAEVFRTLVGGRIEVHVESRPGRKRTNVRGMFWPNVFLAVETAVGCPKSDTEPTQATVWLRKPPRLDALAEPVHELIDNQGLSYREAAKTLQARGHDVNSGNVWYCYRRWYEMQNKPVPDVPYNNGHRRGAA